MSEAPPVDDKAAETPPEDEAVALPTHGDKAFAALMDTLVADEAGEEGAAGDKAAAPDAGAAGSAAAADQGAGSKAGDAAASGGGDAGEPVVPPSGHDDWTTEPAALKKELGDLSVKIEEQITTVFKEAALEETRTEYASYFDAIDQHPRTLVGKTVPSLNGGEDEVLKDSKDAADWQEGVKQLLVEEVNARIGKAMEENSSLFDTAHASLELFQNNPDLTPGSKTFDKELADQFVALAEPYELRVDGKLRGWSIPTQGLINKLRADITAKRTAAPAPKAGEAPPAAKPEEKIDPPQATISSKAGASADDPEDFSTLFGTIGRGYENIRV